jgi:glycosyltransferase involved in cell wall biosynthesis
MIRVVHVVSTMNMGGQETMICDLVQALDPGRFRSSVLVLQTGGALLERLRAGGIPFACLGARDGLVPGLVPRVVRFLWQAGAGVIHTHNFQPLVYAGAASFARPRAPIVATAHGFGTWDGWRFTRQLQAVLRRKTTLVAVSPELRAFLVGRGWPEDRVTLILNGIDTGAFRPPADRAALRAALGVKEDERLVGCVGRLSPEKDHANLVRAMARVVAREPRARALLVGDGACRPELEALAASLGLGERVGFLGERGNIGAFLGALDVYCLPSKTEGTSISLLEAMASGLPIVATAVGGTPSVVEEGAAARLCPPSDAAALADGLLELLGDPARGRQLGEAARGIAEGRFSRRGMGERYGALYERLVAGRG